MQNIFAEKKMQDEFLDRFDNLRNLHLDLNKDIIRDDKRKELLGYTIDDVKSTIDKIKTEGFGGRHFNGELEAIILRFERPAYLVKNDSFDTEGATSTSDLVNSVVNNANDVIKSVIPSVGRINLRNHLWPYAGTGWVVKKNILVTNRHVASLFAAQSGEGFLFIGGSKADLDTLQEYESQKERVYPLRKILWIAPPDMDHDVAFLSIDEESNDHDNQPTPIDLIDKLAFEDISVNHWITVIGYPAFSDRNNHEDQQRIFGGHYGVKRLMPGKITAKMEKEGEVSHDATTLGGASGSLVQDTKSGKAIALHYGGKEGLTNSAVTAPVIADLLQRYVLDPVKKNTFFSVQRSVVQERPSPVNNSLVLSGGTATWRIPLEVSVTVGTPELIPAASSVASAAKTSATAEESLFSSQPELSLADLTAMFSLSSLTKATFDWHTALSLAAASELAYREKAVVEATAEKSWGLTDCKFIDVDDTQCFIASSVDSVLISFRGTQEIEDWLVDFNIRSIDKVYGTVHKGFYNAFSDVKQLLEEELKRQSPKQIVLTGHSLGGALATIAAAEWQSHPIRSVYTFGQPAVGRGTTFSTFFKTNYRDKFFRFVNDDDIVTRVPPNYRHIERLFHFDKHGRLQAQQEAMFADETGSEPKMMSEAEFDTLRAQLLTQRARRESGITESVKVPVLEGFFPSISDHHLSEYIRKIKTNIL